MSAVKAWIYSPKSSERQRDEARCAAAVGDGARSYGWRQCKAKASVRREQDGLEYGFCKMHDPIAKGEKREAERAARAARCDRERTERAGAEARQQAMVDLVEEVLEWNGDVSGWEKILATAEKASGK